MAPTVKLKLMHKLSLRKHCLCKTACVINRDVQNRESDLQAQCTSIKSMSMSLHLASIAVDILVAIYSRPLAGVNAC